MKICRTFRLLFPPKFGIISASCEERCYSDGQTSFETELKLLGVARGSNQELLADYRDYLAAQAKYIRENPANWSRHADEIWAGDISPNGMLQAMLGSLPQLKQ